MSQVLAHTFSIFYFYFHLTISLQDLNYYPHFKGKATEVQRVEAVFLLWELVGV